MNFTKSTFKVHEGNLMEQVGMNRFMAIDFASKALDHTVHGTLGTLQSVYNQDYGAMEQAGHETAGIAANLAGGAYAVGMGVAMHRRFGMHSGFYREKGIKGWAKSLVGRGTYVGVEGGGYAAAAGFRGMSPEKMARYASMPGAATTLGKEAKMVEGFYGRKFFGLGGKGFVGKGMTSGMGMAGLFAVPMAIEMLGGKALGFAGSILDSAHQSYQQAKNIHYDTRFFQNRMTDQWGMDMQSQVGAAMNDFSNRMVSTARIYHSRG